MKFFDGWPILLEHICFWGHFWKYKPPGGLPGTNPGFLETLISAKSQGLKTSWLFVCKVFKVCGAKFQCCGIHFSMRFQMW
jgi:hypothetical protein